MTSVLPFATDEIILVVTVDAVDSLSAENLEAGVGGGAKLHLIAGSSVPACVLSRFDFVNARTVRLRPGRQGFFPLVASLRVRIQPWIGVGTLLPPHVSCIFSESLRIRK